MAIANFIPELWSTALLIALRKAYVFRGLTNSNYTGLVTRVGDTVRINTPDALTINSPATGIPGQPNIVYETPTSTQQVLLIDQSADFAFQKYDIEELQSNVSLMAAYVAEGANGMADTFDQNIAALYVDASVTEAVDQTAIDVATMRTSLIAVSTALSNGSVPSFGRWLVCSPRTIGIIREAYGIETATESGAAVTRNGFVARVEGFDIFESLNVVSTAGPDVDHNIAGYNGAITVADQMAPDVEAIRLENIHGDGVRTLMVWGRKTVRPTGIVEWAVQFGP